MGRASTVVGATATIAGAGRAKAAPRSNTADLRAQADASEPAAAGRSARRSSTSGKGADVVRRTSSKEASAGDAALARKQPATAPSGAAGPFAGAGEPAAAGRSSRRSSTSTPKDADQEFAELLAPTANVRRNGTNSKADASEGEGDVPVKSSGVRFGAVIMESKAVSFMKGLGSGRSSRNSEKGDEVNLTDLSAVAPAEKMVVRPRAGRAARELRETQTAPEKKDAGGPSASARREFRKRAMSMPDRGAGEKARLRDEIAERSESEDEEKDSRWKGAFSKMMKQVKQVAGGTTAGGTTAGGTTAGGRTPLRRRFTVQVRMGFLEMVGAATSAAADEHSAEEIARRESAKQKEQRKKEEARLMKAGLHSNPTYMLRYMALVKPQRKGSAQGNATEGLLLSAESKQGTRDEVWEAWRTWRSIDADTQGYVAMVTFFRWVSDCGKSAHSAKLWEATAGKSERITLKHFLQILWPKAKNDDLDAMVDQAEQLITKATLEVPTPALICAQQRKDLTAVFKSLDADKSGEITVAELVNARFMCHEEATAKVGRFSEDGSNLSLEHFLEMMTPDGYRCSEDATLALCADGDGTLVRKNPNDGKWYRANLRNKDFLRSLYPERYVGAAAAL